MCVWRGAYIDKDAELVHGERKREKTESDDPEGDPRWGILELG